MLKIEVKHNDLPDGLKWFWKCRRNDSIKLSARWTVLFKCFCSKLCLCMFFLFFKLDCKVFLKLIFSTLGNQLGGPNGARINHEWSKHTQSISLRGEHQIYQSFMEWSDCFEVNSRISLLLFVGWKIGFYLSCIYLFSGYLFLYAFSGSLIGF